MDSKYERANSWSNVVIGAAIEVHRLKGAGLLESIYEKCLPRELQLREVPAVGQMQVEIHYKGYTFLEPLNLKAEMAGVETAQATQHQTNPIAPRWTFRVRTH